MSSDVPLLHTETTFNIQKIICMRNVQQCGWIKIISIFSLQTDLNIAQMRVWNNPIWRYESLYTDMMEEEQRIQKNLDSHAK